jgi:hypothetical protein
VSDAARPDHPWRWRRQPGPGWATWQAPLPHELGEDGGLIVVGRRDPSTGRCAACGRRSPLWQATVGLPPPFPGALDVPGGGCTRAHAARATPGGWKDVAAVFAIVAAALHADDQPTFWHERLADMRQRQAERALWLAGQPRAARRLALELWTRNGALRLADTEAVVTAVLSDPARRPPPPLPPPTGHQPGAHGRRSP